MDFVILQKVNLVPWDAHNFWALACLSGFLGRLLLVESARVGGPELLAKVVLSFMFLHEMPSELPLRVSHLRKLILKDSQTLT